MLFPEKDYVQINDLNERLKKLKELKLIPPTAEEIRELFYKGFYVDEPTICDFIGFVDDSEIIIDIKGKPHCIHPVYFKEMQNKDFSVSNTNVEKI